MAANNIRNHILSLAQKALDGKIDGNTAISGRIAEPVAVQTAGGQIHSWFIPVIFSSRLLGFFQFFPDGTWMRFSSFQRKADDLAGCPEAADWLDPERILNIALFERRTDESCGSPFLTYDKTPDRLVWAVPLSRPEGTVRMVYVTGKMAYLPVVEESYE